MAHDTPALRRTASPLRAFATLLLLAAGLMSIQAWAQGLENIRLPAGFSISTFTNRVPGARSMLLGRNNILFVSTATTNGRIYAVRYIGDRATEVITVASGLHRPNGIALHDGALYVSEVSRILRFDDIEARLSQYATGGRQPVVVTNRYPNDASHGHKFIRFGPDGWLYVPVGAPCNICVPDPDKYALISRIRPDGSDYEVVARGVRNSVGFDWHPVTKELWFTDNGRDRMGDEIPHDELNRVTKPGQHFGYPYCHQGDVLDPEPEVRKSAAAQDCSKFVPPMAKLGPHVAALGARFYTGTQFPAEYRNNLFIAQHGSWNRSKKIGYRVVRAIIDGDKPVKTEVFAEGWLDNQERVTGRPVDVQPMPDGSLLVSDDYAGAVYRITYGGK